MRHQLIPYALSQLQQGRSPDGSAGLDFRFALTPQTSAYATLNPDFATIEADQEEVNLTRFELQLPEKRQFFLEGQEHFNQRIRTFYSRRIGDVMGAARSWESREAGPSRRSRRRVIYRSTPIRRWTRCGRPTP